MPSKLTINESSDEPVPTEYGGRIETLRLGKSIGTYSGRSIKEADTDKEVPVVIGGRIERIRKRPSRDKRWFYDDKDNPLRVRQWVYEVFLGATALAVLIGFLVIVISSVRREKLDLQSFLGAIGTFLGGIGIGYGYRAQRERSTQVKPIDDDGEGGDQGGG